MMTDYERVTELQQIAERSQGATAAQAAVYMEGMEAALNKVSVAWEKIVTTVTDSDILIGFIQQIGILLDNLGDFLNSTGGMVAATTVLVTLGLTALGHKMKELHVAREIRKVQLQQAANQAKANVLAQKNVVETKKAAIQEMIITREKNEQILADKTASVAEKQHATEEIARLNTAINTEKNELVIEEQKLHILEEQAEIQTAQTNTISNMLSGLTGLLTPLIAIIGL